MPRMGAHDPAQKVINDLYKRGNGRYKTVNEDCKYWQHSCDLCGITGNDYCPRNCKDFDDAVEDWGEDF